MCRRAGAAGEDIEASVLQKRVLPALAFLALSEVPPHLTRVVTIGPFNNKVVLFKIWSEYFIFEQDSPQKVPL